MIIIVVIVIFIVLLVIMVGLLVKEERVVNSDLVISFKCIGLGRCWVD